jgi:broad specificity phosphatase PhoE
VASRWRNTATNLFLASETVSISPEWKLWKEDVPGVQIVNQMPGNLPRDIKNKYYLLRHGQSTANVDEIISSARSLAYTNRHGLTSIGYDQGFDSASFLIELLKESAKKGDHVVFVSSPLARARETAQACLDGLFRNATNAKQWRDGLGVVVSKHIYYHDLLVERNFGRLDGEGKYFVILALGGLIHSHDLFSTQAIYTYAYVWPLDRMNVTHTAFDVESVAAVCTRFKRLVEDLENANFTRSLENEPKFTGVNHVVCVSHADVLQIAQLYAAEVPNVGEFSSYRFANGEIRRLQPGAGLASLPEPNHLLKPYRGTRT